MSKVWEFSVTPARCAIIAGCLAGAGLMVGGAGFTAGLMLAPRFVALNAERGKVTEAKLEVPKVPKLAAPKLEAPKVEAPTVEVPKVEAPKVEAPKVEAPKLEAAKIEVPKVAVPPAEAKPAEKPTVAAKEAASAPAAKPAEVAAAGGDKPTATTAKAEDGRGGPAAAAPAKPAKPPIQLAVQVGSFSSEENAENTVDRLKRSGYPAFSVSRTDASSRQWHVVQVGPYYAYAAAAKTVLELANTYRLAPVIISSRAY